MITIRTPQEAAQYALDEQVRCAVYETFVAAGVAPRTEDLALQCRVSVAQIAESYQRLAAQRALVLDPGTAAIAMAIPFSATPTPHVVRSGARQWFANCAWDGLGIPALLGCDAVVETTCPASGIPIRIPIHTGQPAAKPCVLHFAIPLVQWWADIGAT